MAKGEVKDGSRWGEAGHLPETWYQYFHQWPLAEALVGLDRAACRLYIGHFLRHWAADPQYADKIARVANQVAGAA